MHKVLNTFYTFDAAYIGHLRNGDEHTVQHFYTYFKTFLRRRLQRRAGSEHQMEDIQQEVFVRVLRMVQDPDAIQKPECFGALIMAVGSNVLNELVRKNRYVLSEEQDMYPDESPDPEALAARAELLDRVRRVLVQLSEHDQKVLYMTFFEGKTNEEAAQELQLKQSCFRVALHRAKCRLRKEMAAMMERPTSAIGCEAVN